MLFMKGNKMFPQCGFSNSAVQVRRGGLIFPPPLSCLSRLAGGPKRALRMCVLR